AKIVRQCRDLPGQELFQYRSSAGIVDVGSADVNAYLKQLSGRDFTSKDFRTWAGTVLAATFLRECGAAESATRAQKNVVAAIDRVAKQLGNTRAVCRKSYVHPAVIAAYLDGTIRARGRRRDTIEDAVLRLLSARAA